MRFIITIISVLMMLGLAAFGVVSAQKTSTARSQATASDSAVASGLRTEPAAARRPPVNPVSQVAQTDAEPASAASAPAAAAPVRVAQATQTTPAAPSAASAPPKPAPSATAIPACDKPGGMGLTRIVEIDTTGGPGFGFEHFKQYDFLRDKEVVLTFDDGPWPGNTPAVLKALADECLKATFFEIGEHATWHPEITKQVIAAGMTVGTHTWSHQGSGAQPVRQGHRTGQGGNRDGYQRGAHGCRRRKGRSVLPLSGPAASAAALVVPGRAQYRSVLHRHRTRAISSCTSRKR